MYEFDEFPTWEVEALCAIADAARVVRDTSRLVGNFSGLAYIELGHLGILTDALDAYDALEKEKHEHIS